MSNHDTSLSVVMVSYNTCQLTLTAIACLFEHAEHPLELIVLDNYSQDGSADQIEARFPSVKLIRSKSNLGFGLANNEAVQVASGDVLLLLNPDTEIYPGAIRELMHFRKRHPEARIWGGHTFFADGSRNPSSCWNQQTIWSLFVQAIGLSSVFRNIRMFNPERVHALDSQESSRVDIVSGCFLLIDRAFFNRLGGFRERFFMYGEDADLCLRAKTMGARPMVTRSARIIHHGGASEKIRVDKLVRLMQAKATLILEHFPPRRRDFGLFLLFGWPASRVLAYKLLNILSPQKYKESASVWGAVWSRRGEWSGGFPALRHAGSQSSRV